MDETKFEVGQEVTLLGVSKKGTIESISEDGATFVVKYTDDENAEQTETVTADKIAAIQE